MLIEITSLSAHRNKPVVEESKLLNYGFIHIFSEYHGLKYFVNAVIQQHSVYTNIHIYRMSESWC